MSGFHTMSLRSLLRDARRATPLANDVADRMARHSMRSKGLVAQLAAAFHRSYAGTGHHVAWRGAAKGGAGDPDHQFEFSEFLFDIVVAKLAYTETQKGRSAYLMPAVWHVESELSTKTKQVVADCAKLLQGNAPYKLFVGHQNWHELLLPLLASQRMDAGRFFVAAVGLPQSWNECEPCFQLWEYVRGDSGPWLELSDDAQAHFDLVPGAM